MGKSEETTAEFFERKAALAKAVLDDWEEHKIPILVVVERNTANAFVCLLYYTIHELAEDRGVHPKVYLAHHFETNLIETFEEKYKVNWELGNE